MTTTNRSRRSFLLSAAAALGASLTGCTGSEPEGKGSLASAPSPLPGKVAAIYWRMDASEPLAQVHPAYNVINLFAAVNGRPRGNVVWNRPGLVAGLNAHRENGTRIVLTVGGAGQGLRFTSRTVSKAFVAAIVRINIELGGTPATPVLDGLDFNTFEASAYPDIQEYQWIVRELRARFGARFGITSPPAPWSQRDAAFCRGMFRSDDMDYAGLQFYDGPGLTDPEYILERAGTWIDHVADGDQSRIVIGFSAAQMPQYSSMSEIKQTWLAVEDAFPDIRGVFLWEHSQNRSQPRRFANQIVPLVL